MAVPQPLLEAGLSLEYQDEGATLIVRDARPDASNIRNRGGEALAQLLQANRAVKRLDLRESGISDNGIGHVCLALRQTDQLESLALSPVGHAGLDFLVPVVRRCGRLTTLSATFVDTKTLVAAAQNVVVADYDVSAYAGQPKGEAEEEEEEEPAAPAEDEDEEPEERERKKLARLRKLLNENDHDSSDEAEASMRNASCSAAPHGASAALLQRLGAFVDAVRAKPNLTAVECRGDCIPADVQREIARAVQDHCEAQERRRQTQEARGARTAYDALRDQMAELAGFAAAETAGDALGGELLPGEEAGPDGVTRMGIRRFVGRRLFAALGEALFECQRFKSKENEAVADWQGECAFLAMYIRKLAKEKDRK